MFLIVTFDGGIYRHNASSRRARRDFPPGFLAIFIRDHSPRAVGRLHWSPGSGYLPPVGSSKGRAMALDFSPKPLMQATYTCPQATYTFATGLTA